MAVEWQRDVCANIASILIRTLVCASQDVVKKKSIEIREVFNIDLLGSCIHPAAEEC